MSIEQAIAANTAAIEKLTAALVATANLAPAAGTTKAADTKAAVAKVTRDEMVAILKELGETKSSDVAKLVIKEVGKSAKMADIKDAQIAAVYAAAKEKLAEETAPPADDGL